MFCSPSIPWFHMQYEWSTFGRGNLAHRACRSWQLLREDGRGPGQKPVDVRHRRARKNVAVFYFACTHGERKLTTHENT